MALELSILIATMPTRLKCFSELISDLNSQIKKCNAIFNIEIITDESMDYNVGIKRNKLLNLANGKYIVYADDDDFISPNYISLILQAIKSDADCIGINGTITTDGKNKKQWFISKEYGKWFEKNNIYYRTPNHISPVKRELALKAGFPNISFAEDAEYSKRLLPLLKTETIIKETIYHYAYISRK